MRFLIVLSAFAVLLVGCNADAPHGYFPLVEGLAWHYHVTRSDPLGSHETSRLIMTNLDPTTLDQSRVFERRNSFGSHYYIDRRADGYYRVARRRLIDYRPSPDQPARMVLPLEPQVGRYWQHPTATYLLKRILPFPTRYRYGRPIEMVFHVAATGLNVTVPAGSYDGCVRVDGEARIQVASDPRQGLSSVPISQREWYCPAVGLVRLTRQEKLYSEQATVVGGRLEMELIRLDNGRLWAALWRRLKSWL